MMKRLSPLVLGEVDRHPKEKCVGAGNRIPAQPSELCKESGYGFYLELLRSKSS